LLGKPNQGFHTHRIPGLDIAVVDVAGTVVLAIGTSLAIVLPQVWSWDTTIPLFIGVTILAFFAWLVIATGIHLLFGADTRMNVLIFGRVGDAPVGAEPAPSIALVEDAPPAAPTSAEPGTTPGSSATEQSLSA